MWSEPIYSEQKDIHVIVLDFEPFSKQGRDLDIKLLQLAMMASSQIFFNMASNNGNLEERSLE
jgi:hypothetical protein